MTLGRVWKWLVIGGLPVATIVALSLALGARTSAQDAPHDRASNARKRVERIDRAALSQRLRAAGHRKVGGIEKAKTDSENGRFHSLPHFSSSFKIGQTTFPYTMLGYPPVSGRTARLRSVIIPLRMQFVFFDEDAVFEPTFAVDNIVHSPMFEDAPFPNGVGQFGDMMQRATFWNKMDRDRRWHVRMARPRVTKPITILVEPDIGELIRVGDGPSDLIGNIRFGALDSQLHTILDLTGVVEPDEVPIFVTQNVFADALGYHDAFAVDNDDDTETLQTLIYTSWLDINLVGDLLADVSTLNHELSEWLNDPFVNNIVPTWLYPPSNIVCSDNPFLETGDPQGNGPEFFLFPTVPITINNFTYHLQDLVMLPWFAQEQPSSAQNGWYDFPDTRQITTPAKFCQ